jgi:hypothetical protein
MFQKPENTRVVESNIELLMARAIIYQTVSVDFQRVSWERRAIFRAQEMDFGFFNLETCLESSKLQRVCQIRRDNERTRGKRVPRSPKLPEISDIGDFKNVATL